MSVIGSERFGWYDPRDLVIWRSVDGSDPAGGGPGSGQALTDAVRDLLEISIVSITATIDAPWEMIIKERVKPGASKAYGNRYFDLEDELWLTDRNSAPNTEGTGPATTRVIFYGTVKKVSIEKSGAEDYYIFQVLDRRSLMRDIPVTFGGPSVSDPHVSQGANRIVFNAPPGDIDGAFDLLGGDRSSMRQILDSYFAHFSDALSAIAGVQQTYEVYGWDAGIDDVIPGKIVLEDVNFEEGLTAILSSVPHVRWYVPPRSANAKVVFVSSLRLSRNHVLQYPQLDSPSRDYVTATSMEIDTSGVYTAVKIIAKTGKVKNNWSRMISGLGFETEGSSSGASVVPRQAPKQPGISVGIKVNTRDAAYYETWADAIRLGTWGSGRYWPFANLPDGGGGTKQPIYCLAMWERRFEEDFRGDGSLWTGYKQQAILGGHVHGGAGQSSAQNITMSPIAKAAIGSTITFLDPVSGNGIYDFPTEDGFIYKLTDTANFWRSAGFSEITTSPRSVAVDRRRRRGPWAGGLIIIPPQPGVQWPAGLADGVPIKLEVNLTSGSDVYCSVVPEQRGVVTNTTFTGNKVGASWYYELVEPGNKLQGPDGNFYSIGGRWSAMFRNYRLFDPEMVWRYVNSSGVTTEPRFAAFAPEVCFVGIFSKSNLVLNPGFRGEIPDPSDTTAWKSQASTVFFPLFPRLGGHPDTDSALFSTGPTRAVEAIYRPGSTTEFSFYGIPFDIQFGWYEVGGEIQVRYPAADFEGEGFTDYGIRREKIYALDISEYLDDPTEFGYLEDGTGSSDPDSRLGRLATDLHRSLCKVPRIGSVSLHGLDFDLCTRVNKTGDPADWLPFTYIITQDIDQDDVRTPPLGLPKSAAAVGYRYDLEAGTTQLDLTEDRSGFARDFIGELISEFRARQSQLQLRATAAQFKAFSECIQQGQSGGAGGTGFAGQQSDPCTQSVPDPRDSSKLLNICTVLAIIYQLAKKGGSSQPKGFPTILTIGGGVTSTGGMVEFDYDPDVNPLTYRYDEFPAMPIFGPPISSEDFTRRGHEFVWDAAHQRTVLEKYAGGKNRYNWWVADLDSDGITLRKNTTDRPVMGGVHGSTLAFLADFLGWSPDWQAQLSEDEGTDALPFSIASQTIGLRNTSFASWRFYEPDEVPSDCVLYLDFEEASGSLYDLSRYKRTLAASGTPSYGETGLVTGELGIKTVQGASSFSVTLPSLGYLPFHVLLRIKLHDTGISQTLVSNYSSTNGFKVEIDTSNRLVFTVGDGTNSCTVTHSTTMSVGTWYSFICRFYRAGIDIVQSDGTTSTGTIGAVLHSISTSSPATAISGSVTWDELYIGFGQYGQDDAARVMAPAGMRHFGPSIAQRSSSLAVNTSDTNGGVASCTLSVTAGATTSPVVFYLDSEAQPELALLSGHTYRLTLKVKTGSGSPTVAPWIENRDRRQLLTSAGAFTDADTALTLTISSSAWTTNEVVFTVPDDHEDYDRWRLGLRVASSSGTVTVLWGGAPAIMLEEIPANEEDTEYKLVDSGGVRLAELDADGLVAEIA